LIIRKEELFVKMRILNTEYIEAGAELPQVVKRISPLENKQRQQYNGADVWYKQQQACTAEAASYTKADENNCPYRYCYDDLKEDVQCEAGFIDREDCQEFSPAGYATCRLQKHNRGDKIKCKFPYQGQRY
jgi:hypothetical protein